MTLLAKTAVDLLIRMLNTKTAAAVPIIERIPILVSEVKASGCELMVVGVSVRKNTMSAGSQTVLKADAVI